MTAIRRAIGLMSGTSMDGIDIALVETDGDNHIAQGPTDFAAYDPAFRRKLEAALEEAKVIRSRQERPGTLIAVEQELTKRHADAVEAFLSKNNISKQSIEIIGFHGQTVLHRPAEGLTVQLGDGQMLADLVGIPVVFDVRANDMRHGGQGAPLVPAYHRALSAKITTKSAAGPVVFVNIGGISNVTITSGTDDPIAFDTGPGNNLIDQWVFAKAGLEYDESGRTAAQGNIKAEALNRYLAKPYFDLKPPKSLDRADFSLAELGDVSLTDGARTLARLAADAVLAASTYAQQSPSLWVICGGGRKNAVIMADLAEGAARSNARVIPAEDLGINGDSVEAEAWAYLAVRSLEGLPLTWPTTTGCDAPVTGGVLVRPV